MSDPEHTEQLIVDCAQAKSLAEVYRTTDHEAAKPDPFKDIPHSLLSAEHIKKYVEATGLISPFYIDGGKKSRLKKAAYEGRMGDSAYLYRDDHKPKRVLFPASKDLTVPANSIVYVECDLEFRLPEFIALRFNLQIQHVHRGLLLGTGPLVDPGFWGKLCIPLHNLTDQPYVIPREVGLIWLEFTKTTSDLTKEERPIGRPPLASKEFWDITEFLSKASKQFDPNVPAVPLRSSLPEMFDDATKQSKEAAESAKSAADSSKTAEAEAGNARKSAERTRNLGILAAFGAFATLLALWITFWLETRDYAQEMVPVAASVTALGNVQGAQELELDRLRAEFEQEIQQLNATLRTLRDENALLSQQLREIADIISDPDEEP